MSSTINTSNIKLGACNIYAWDGNGYQFIGGTVEGAMFSYEPSFNDIKLDQTGDTIVKKILAGEVARLTFTAAENTKDNLQLAMPLAVQYVSGSQRALSGGRNAGADLLEEAVKFKVHPLNTRGDNNTDDATYEDDDIYIWKGVNAQSVELPFKPNEIRRFKITIDAYPDFDRDEGNYLFWIGDPDVASDTTAPSINAVDPADGETGVAATKSIVALTDEVLRMTDDDTPNARVFLNKISDHSDVDATVSAEQYVEGTATAGDATTLTLEAGDVFADDCMNGLYVELVSGTGADVGELTAITDSATGANTITVAAWPNGTPDSTTGYKIYSTRITIDPDSAMTSAAEYQLIIDNAYDLAGNRQDAPFVSSFTIA